MKIGFDLDNTIISYDRLFYALALERCVPPEAIVPNKESIRDYFRGIGEEDSWTAMQGEAYGGRILEAELFPGVIQVLERAVPPQFEVFIISHKTKFPFAGPQYDLHAAGRSFLTAVGVTQYVPDENIFFCETKAEKFQKIHECRCELFVDDLPEILMHSDFPTSVKDAVLFDPHRTSPGGAFRVIHSWLELMRVIS